MSDPGSQDGAPRTATPVAAAPRPQDAARRSAEGRPDPVASGPWRAAGATGRLAHVVRLAWRGLRGARALAGRLPGLALRLLFGFALGSALLVGALRWVDPPASAFMIRHAIDGWRLGRTPPYYRHRWVPWGRIPPVLPLAVIAAEDQRFPLHHGFDPVEIRRALATWRAGGRLRGASTVSQQTAKNLFLWPGRSWVRKGLEAWLTALIELLWPKSRILEVYLNIVQFSPSTYGVGAASLRYFKRPVEDLTLHQAALLAGVLPAPGAYRLDRPSARLLRRADWIADQTRRLGGRRYLGRL